MKIYKLIACLTALMLASVIFTACKDDSQQVGETNTLYHTVTFSDGESVSERTVKSGETVTEPAIPEQEGYIFDGWYRDNYAWDFSSAITQDMILTARWLTPDRVFNHSPSEDGSTTIITGLKQKRAQIRLPSTINGYTVTGIADGVFKNISSNEVTKIILPENITSVGYEAFMDCVGISITVEGKLTEVGEKAFLNCDGLTAIELGDGLESIPFEAFKCTGIKSIFLPKSVTLIDDNAFERCLSLETVIMHCAALDINDGAFNGAGIKNVYLFGTDADAVAMLDDVANTRNDALTGGRIFLYSEAKPTEDTDFNGFWYFDDNGKRKIWN